MGVLVAEAQYLRRQVTRWVSAQIGESTFDSEQAKLDLKLVNLVCHLARVAESMVPEGTLPPTSTDEEVSPDNVEELAQVLFAQAISPEQWPHATRDTHKRWRELALTALQWKAEKSLPLLAEATP